MDKLIDTVFPVYKIKGITSAKFLNIIKKKFKTEGFDIKIGHGGTLDPDAVGVLIIGTGKGTKLLNNELNGDKTYKGVVTLGWSSNTYDSSGKLTKGNDLIPTKDDIENILKKFIGEKVEQIPPIYSAIRINGVRAHKIARNNKIIDMPKRYVKINKINIIDYTYPKLQIEVDCGKGTYIRSLAHDIGLSLGCGAYLENLERLSSGRFTIKDCVDLKITI